MASEAAALKREAMTAAAVLGLDVTSRIPDVVAPIPTRKAPVAQQQPAAVLQQAQSVAQEPAQLQAANQPAGLQPDRSHTGVQTQQPTQQPQPQTPGVSQSPAQPSSQPQNQSSVPSQQLQTQSVSVPQLPAYSAAQLLSLVMPKLQAQSHALQNGVLSQAPSQLNHMSAPAQASQVAGQQQLPETSQVSAQAQSQAQQLGAILQAPQVSGQQPQLQQPFSFLSLLQQQPASVAAQRGLLDQLAGQSSGQQLSGLSLPSASGQTQQVSNVAAGLMQLLQQQADSKQQAVAQQPALKQAAEVSHTAQ